MRRRLLMMLAQRLISTGGSGSKRGQGYRASSSDYPTGRTGARPSASGPTASGHPSSGHPSSGSADPGSGYRRDPSPIASEAQRIAKDLWPVLNTPQNRALAKDLLKRVQKRR